MSSFHQIVPLVSGFLLALAGSAVAAQPVNPSFTGPTAWKTSLTIPANATPIVYPDGVSRAPGDYVFSGGAASIWTLDQGAAIICTQTGGGAYNRFYIGRDDGTRATLTFTSSTPRQPGSLCARGSTSDSIRVGEARTKSSGTLIIDGGARLQTGNIHGEGPSPILQILNGRLDVLSETTSHRLNGLAITLSPRGQLWIEDFKSVIKSAATFATYAKGASVTASSGSLVFENNVAIVPATGTATLGTLVTVATGVDPSLDTDHDGLPDSWENLYGLDPADNGTVDPDSGPAGDSDHDGLSNLEEYRLGSNPVANESGKPWQARPTKAAMLIVNAHPDDEGIFFGGCFPYYTQVKKLPVIALSMTSGDFTLPPALREAEFRNAVWAYGLRHQPIFARFRDDPTSTLDQTWDVWADGKIDGLGISEGRTKAARYVATVIRRYRPDIVVTHGTNGEYGHQNHVATSLATIDAWTLAADPTLDLEGLPPWQAKKLYVHEWGQNRLFHDYWETPFPEFGGRTPRQVTNTGLAFQVSQGKTQVSTAYLNFEVDLSWDAHPSELWGLYASTVGFDTPSPAFTVNHTTYTGWAKRDFLEHIHIDLNENGLPDDWETLHSPLTGTLDPHADPDGDGLDNLTEYICGTLPGSKDGPLLSVNALTHTATFSTRPAAGTGYSDLHRRYRLESSTDLSPASWIPVWQGDADGTIKEIALPADGPRRFFHLVTILE